jgi:hypothetical protein
MAKSTQQEEENSFHCIWSIADYGTENETLMSIEHKKLRSFEMSSWRRKEKIIWNDV